MKHYALLFILLSSPLWAEPLTLLEAQKLALEHSHRLKIESSEVREAKHRVDEVYSGVRPQLSLKAGGSYLTPQVSFPMPQGALAITEAGNYNLGLHLDQAVLTFGRLKWGSEAAELAQEAKEMEVEREREDILASVSQAYLDLVFAQREVQVAQKQVRTRGSHLEQARLKLKAGTIPPFEVLSFETSLAQAEQGLILSDKRREMSKTRLLLMLGRQAREALEVSSPTELSEFEESPDIAVSRALEKRPGLQALRKAVGAAEAKVKYEESQNNPSLGFRTSYLRQNSTAFQPNQMWVAGLQLNVPLYDGGASRARAAQAEEQVLQLRENLAEAERNIVMEVEGLHLDLVSGLERLRVARTALKQADEHLRLAGLRYKVGVSTHLELLQAETSQAEARLAVHESNYHLLKSYIAWRRATGLSLELGHSAR